MGKTNERDGLAGCTCWATVDREERRLCPVHGDGSARPKISPTLIFEGGSLTIRMDGFGSENGSGHFACKDDDLDWDEGDYRSVRIPASEFIEIRDWLNRTLSLTTAAVPAEPSEGVVERMMFALAAEFDKRSGSPTKAVTAIHAGVDMCREYWTGMAKAALAANQPAESEDRHD